MSAVLEQPRAFRGGRWWMVLALVFAGQLGFIFWLGERSLQRPAPPRPGPGLQLMGNVPAEFLALNDPTLFALPHPQGFAGLAWLKVPPPKYRPFAWAEPDTWVELPGDTLGATFYEFLKTNAPQPIEPLVDAGPVLMLPEVSDESPFPEESSVRILGELANWSPIKAFDLPSWPGSDLVSNSVVQLLVNARGEPVSAVLLQPGSGSAEADQFALNQAASARFVPKTGKAAPAPARPAGRLTWGTVVFEWHTIPAASTNAPTP